MECPISKFVPQPDTFWHQPPSNNAFKSPDLIELSSDTERKQVDPEPLNYSSSQEEVETEDDCADQERAPYLTEVLNVFDASNDEESCHLLQTEDDSENSDSDNGRSSANSSVCNSSSAEATISDEEGGVESNSTIGNVQDNYWDMTAEQDKYYCKQFLSLQPDISGVVSGKLAKGFFEKSKLPHLELREIWQLADITKDGCLDLSEFKMAMHLVVLRRHGLPIPSHFLCRPQEVLNGTSSAANNNAKNYKPSTTIGSSTTTPKPTKPPTVDKLPQKPSKEWTTFDNEPINFSTTCDTSGLVAPVPVRLSTPEDKILLNSSGPPCSSSKSQHLQLKAIQRPKLSGHTPKVSSGTIAPPPPPRRKTHVRSSSLDLNKLSISSDASHQGISSSIASGGELPARSFLSPSHQGGAFSVYRKPTAETIHEPPSIPCNESNSKSTLQQEIENLKNENNILSRSSALLLDQLSNLQARNEIMNCKLRQYHSSDMS